MKLELILSDYSKFSNSSKILFLIQIHLEKSGIQTRTIFTGNITKQPVAKKFKWKSSGSLKYSNKIMVSGILIGCHELINNEDLTIIKEKLDDFFV